MAERYRLVIGSISVAIYILMATKLSDTTSSLREIQLLAFVHLTGIT